MVSVRETWRARDEIETGLLIWLVVVWFCEACSLSRRLHFPLRCTIFEFRPLLFSQKSLTGWSRRLDHLIAAFWPVASSPGLAWWNLSRGHVD